MKYNPVTNTIDFEGLKPYVRRHKLLFGFKERAALRRVFSLSLGTAISYDKTGYLIGGQISTAQNRGRILVCDFQRVSAAWSKPRKWVGKLCYSSTRRRPWGRKYQPSLT